MENIRFIDLDKLDRLERAIVESISKNGYDKLQREFNDIFLVVHPKKEDTGGRRSRYVINARIEHGEGVLGHADSEEWELEKAMHEIMNKLENGIQHKFKTKGK